MASDCQRISPRAPQPQSSEALSHGPPLRWVAKRQLVERDTWLATVQVLGWLAPSLKSEKRCRGNTPDRGRATSSHASHHPSQESRKEKSAAKTSECAAIFLKLFFHVCIFLFRLPLLHVLYPAP